MENLEWDLLRTGNIVCTSRSHDFISPSDKRKAHLRFLLRCTPPPPARPLSPPTWARIEPIVNDVETKFRSHESTAF